MALSSGTTARIVDAMTTDIVPHNSNPLPHQVIHATAELDLRIQSIEDDPKLDETIAKPAKPDARTPPKIEDDAYKKDAQKMRAWWDEAIGKNLHLPDGYAHVAVLLIKWDDELDELKTAEETKELRTLFEKRFNYTTKTIELTVRQKPQHQLKAQIGEFIQNHDSPQTLFIVYYTGHGTFHDDTKMLELTATQYPSSGKGFRKDARASWNKVEELLKDEDVDGDVLTILDSCYSSNLVKSGREESKKFELLSACAIDQTTARPGTRSFTRALIDALVKLLDEYPDRPISTSTLVQRINLDPRRDDTPSFLWSRGTTVSHNEQHILLAPLKQTTSRPLRPKSYLTVRLGLNAETLTQRQIDFMARQLTKTFHNKAMVGLRRIDWVDIEPAPPISQWERVTLIISFVKKWREVIRKRNEKNRDAHSEGRVHELTSAESMDIDPTESSQKRGREGADGLPNAKRRNLEVSQPPSPPISNSSRIDYDA